MCGGALTLHGASSVRPLGWSSALPSMTPRCNLATPSSLQRWATHQDYVETAFAIILKDTAFLLFRLFDVWKPYPINYVDNNVKGSLGIMLDDIIASVYSITVLCIIFFFLGG